GRDPVHAPAPHNLLAQPLTQYPAEAPGGGVRQRIVDLIARALAIDPAARFTSMEAMRAALDRAAQTTAAATITGLPAPSAGRGRLHATVVRAADSLRDTALRSPAV